MRNLETSLSYILLNEFPCCRVFMPICADCPQVLFSNIGKRSMQYFPILLIIKPYFLLHDSLQELAL